MPRLGQAMQEGTILQWHVAEAQAVAAGTPFYLLETDKVETEIEVPVAGTVRLVAATDTPLAVGTVIAYIDES